MASSLPPRPQAASKKGFPATETETTQPKKEDDVTEGESIDTFSTFVPTALPPNLMEAILSPTIVSHNDGNREDSFKSNVIEILDSDNDDSTLMETTMSGESCGTSDTCATTTSASMSRRSDDSATNASLPNDNSIFVDGTVPSHSFPACESALLASVAAPRVSNESASCLLELAKSKALSPLQLEGAALAIHRHNRIFLSSSQISSATTMPNKRVRAGFFLGDGAGIGKGRQIASVLLDSFCRGRKRHLWISVSRDLCTDAQRDLKAVDCHVSVYNGTDELQFTKNGVLFVTYSFLVSGKRMEEIIAWLTKCPKTVSPETNNDFEGVVVFDEAHKAKNLQADTLTAKRVVELQERLPLARVLYCSATGVSDLSHMVYANRLGLWGMGNPLYPTFEAFSQTLSQRGGSNHMGALELLACEMKQGGMFAARTLSWKGAEFETLQVPVAQNVVLRSMYDGAVAWWRLVRNELKDIETKIFNKGDANSVASNLWRNYWAAHLRFFREMTVCAKMPAVIQQAKEYLKEDYAIVIGLQSTGEASTKVAVEEWQSQEEQQGQNHRTGKNSLDDVLFPDLLSTVSSTMLSFIKNNFPVSFPPPEPMAAPTEGSTKEQREYYRLEAERIKNLPPPLPIPELVEKRRVLLEHAKHLVLPPNPLDHLIDQLGGTSNVAELTGRSGRIVRYQKKKRNGQHLFHYEKRTCGAASNKKSFGLDAPISQEDNENRLNLLEKKKFLEGKKSVAIVSDAASTGIGLHAAEGTGAAHKRRIHFTIELPWAADKAIQQLGRSHRSGQLSAPLYKLVVTELGGERRFGAAMAKRMANLGALTKGDRRAATGSHLSEFDIDSKYGRRALTRFYQCVRDCVPSNATIPSRHGHVVLDKYNQDASMAATGKGGSPQWIINRRQNALLVARDALLDVCLRSNEMKKNNTDIRIFLNRIAGLAVSTQNLVFSLFHSTFQDVIEDAKATGEYEGSVEAVKATTIDFEREPEVIAVDARSGAETKLIRFVVDRGISLDNAVEMSQQAAALPLATNDSQDRELPAVPRKHVAESGFYVSKRTIAGRELVLFAKRKVEPDVGEDAESKNVHDPLGLMVITRPNTGTNPCEMSTKDLDNKYRLLVSSRDLCKTLHSAESESEVGGDNIDGGKFAQGEVVRTKYTRLGRLWDGAYGDSNVFEYGSSLAPRKSRLGLVTGAVLHVLPALEKAVGGQRFAADRALRVTRVELTKSSQRVVGIRFPLQPEPLDKIRTNMKSLTEARKCRSGSEFARLFCDEEFTAINDKTKTWATTQPKTMRNFFSSSAADPKKRKKPSDSDSHVVAVSSPELKDNKVQHHKKKLKRTAPTSIKSFFSKK